MNKIELSKESKEILKKTYVMTTDHTLDVKLRKAIEEVLDKTMTSSEKSLWGYEYYIEHKQYNDDLETNKNILRGWANNLKKMGNANFPYVYAIERVLRELDKGDKQ